VRAERHVDLLRLIPPPLLRRLPGLPECHPLVLPRDGRWPELRERWLKAHPRCAVCGTTAGVVPHHIRPVHVWPEQELLWSNLLSLCGRCHLLIGHLGAWASWNPDVVKDAAGWSERIRRRPVWPKK